MLKLQVFAIHPYHFYQARVRIYSIHRLVQICLLLQIVVLFINAPATVLFVMEYPFAIIFSDYTKDTNPKQEPEI